MTILAVTGMAREAAIARRAGIVAVSCGGDVQTLRTLLRDVNPREGVISFGIAAGLLPGAKPGTVVLATEVSDDPNRYYTDDAWREAMRAKLPDAKLDLVAGLNVVLDTPRAKASIREQTHAIAADMESHEAGRFAQERGVPFAVLRVIADPAESALPYAATVGLKPDGNIAFGAVFKALRENPRDIPALIRTGFQAQTAFAALLRCVNALGPRFAAPDLG